MRPPSRSVASRTVVKVLVRAACLITLDGPSREALQKPAKEPVERHNAMALDQSALLEVLDALKVADVGVRVPQATETVYQALIEAELTDTIGAALHERSEHRTNLRNGHRTRILST